jgi:hypothetical protein
VPENRMFPKESVVVLNTVLNAAALARDFLHSTFLSLKLTENSRAVYHLLCYLTMMDQCHDVFQTPWKAPKGVEYALGRIASEGE